MKTYKSLLFLIAVLTVSSVRPALAQYAQEPSSPGNASFSNPQRSMNPGERNKDAIDILNVLIKTCRDAQNGYRTAAAYAQEESLRSFLQVQSENRAYFVHELQEQVSSLGGKAAESGSVIGAAYRGWMKVKATVSRHKAKAVLASVEKGDKEAIEEYNDALSKNLTADARHIVENQLRQMQESLVKIKNFQGMQKHQ